MTANYNWYGASSKEPYTANLVRYDGYDVRWYLTDHTLNPIQYDFGVQNKMKRMSKTQFNFAFAVMAGIAIDISKNAKLDLGYRYLNMGKWGNSKTAATSHDFRMGFRYAID